MNNSQINLMWFAFELIFFFYFFVVFIIFSFSQISNKIKQNEIIDLNFFFFDIFQIALKKKKSFPKETHQHFIRMNNSQINLLWN